MEYIRQIDLIIAARLNRSDGLEGSHGPLLISIKQQKTGCSLALPVLYLNLGQQ
ncbi:hypothetical protein D3C74_417420 [compost metagenome]